MTQPAVERNERPKCPRSPDCPGHCTLCLKPMDECKSHDPARYERFGMSKEPARCPDQPRPKPEKDETETAWQI